MTRCRRFRTVAKDEREKGAMPEQTATDGWPHTIVRGEVPPGGAQPVAEAPPPEAPPVDEPPEPPSYEPPTADVDLPPEPAPEPVEEPAAGAPVPPVSPDLDTAELSDEPLGVKADDDDDPGLLEQIAEVMGNLWDDSKGMVT
jgi:hypothetical protein